MPKPRGDRAAVQTFVRYMYPVQVSLALGHFQNRSVKRRNGIYPLDAIVCLKEGIEPHFIEDELAWKAPHRYSSFMRPIRSRHAQWLRSNLIHAKSLAVKRKHIDAIDRALGVLNRGWKGNVDVRALVNALHEIGQGQGSYLR